MIGDLRRAVCLVTAAILVCAVATVSQAQRYGISTYTNADGLPQAQVLSIYQDSRGYMWFGTYGGVARFDGVDYEVLASADGLVGNVVTAIAESRGGRMFFGTSEGVTVLDEGRLSELFGPEGESISGVQDIFTDTRRGRWIATDHGLYRERGGEVVRFTEADGLPSRSIHTVTRDAGGYLWVGTERGVSRLSGERFLDVPQGLPLHAPVHAIVAHEGALWVGTDAGIYRNAGAGFVPVELPPSASALAREVVDATVEAGGVWFATPGGAVNIGAETARVLTTDNGLVNHNIRAVAADREGNLWFGTDDGVAKLVPGPFVVYNDRDGLPQNFVRDMAEDRAGRIWFGTRGGVAVLETDGSFRQITAADGLTDGRVFALAALPGDEVLFGTSSGLFQLRDGIMRSFTADDGLPSSFVRALARDRTRGDVWIGTDAGLARWRDGHIEALPPDPELGALSVLALEVDPAGDLWIATQGAGLVTYDGTSFTPRAQDLALQEVDLWSLAYDWDGGMWVGTNGRGAYRIVGDQAVRMSTAEGLVNDFVWQVHSDRSGKVWFYTNRGLDRWDGAAITHFGPADGLGDLEGAADSVLEDSEGNLWFGTGKGVTKYVPALERPRNVAPLVQLRGASRDGRSVPLGAEPSELDTPYGGGALTIAYAGLSFYDEDAIRYRHRLLGLDDEWSAPSRERQVSFAQLAPGHYTFEVQAASARSDWSETPATVSFSVTPGLMQSAWFRLLMLATLALGVLAVYLWRHAQEQREMRKLEQMVALRTEQLAKSEDRMRTALKNSPTFVFSQDRELRYTWTHNPMLGLPADAILGERDEDFLDPEAAHILTELKQSVLDSGTGARREVTVCRGDDCHELDVSVEPLWDGETIVGITGAAWDVTKQRELERQLRQSQKMEVVGQLAGGVAHDFNNLLTGITGYAELGKGRLPIDSPVVTDFDQVLRCARRAADLTQQLLAFSRRQPLEPTTVSPAELVEDVSTLLHRLIGEDIALRVSVDPDLHPVQIDRSQIETVLANLAVNARDAMPDGGELHIAASNARFDRATARLRRVIPGEYVSIVVADTGTGMSPETLDHIFEPFFTTKEVGKGTGLGLATAYGIVKQHGGYLLVESELGGGTTFEILLPVTTEDVDVVEPEARRPPPGGNEVILLVEDEAAVREVTERWLAQIGYTVYAAEGPVQAEEIYRRRAPHIDLLLTDVVMPKMSGPELYQRLASDGGQPRVLYMSGYLDRGGHKQNLIDSHAPFIQKPFELNALADKVRSVLDAYAVV